MSGRESSKKGDEPSKKSQVQSSVESAKTNGEVTGSTNNDNFDLLISPEDATKPKSRPTKHDSGAADLEKVTDYAEETEISSKDIEGAMTLIGDKRSKENAEREARKRELDKVVIKKEDVELIIQELEIPKSQAELTLRENRGDVVKALIALTD